MRILVWAVSCASLTLAACSDFQSLGSTPSNQLIRELPEGVIAIAAPYQDLNAVRIDPSDGCFVYRHVGPVETTYLPLRSVNGRPICSRS